MLEVSGIRKTFVQGRVATEVIRGISLTVADGEFVSLIGPSGCGKTTLLKIVAGLPPPTAGQVALDGKPSLAPSRQKAFVFQHFNLFPWRTVLDNAAYALELDGVDTRTRAERARGLLQGVGLAGFEQYYPAQISGGMRQRVGLVRALLLNPRVLLMDEPFGALDALTREVLQGELLRLLAATPRVSTLFVTHSIDEAIYLSDRILVFSMRPASVVREFAVPLRKPRYEYNWRRDPTVVGLREEIWNLLREAAQHGT